MNDKEKLIEAITKLLPDTPERALRFVLSFLQQW